RGPAPELRLRGGVREDWDLVSVKRNARFLAGEVLEPCIVGMDDHRATGDEQLRPRRRDPDLPFRDEREFHPDEIRRQLLVVAVGLREWRLADGTPERRPFAAIEESSRPEF